MPSYESWRTQSLFSPRSASLPPLTVFEANAGRIGVLDRTEITSLIAYSSNLADLRYLVGDLRRSGRMEQEDKQLIAQILANAWLAASVFLKNVSERPEAYLSDRYENQIAKLEGAYRDSQGTENR
jgi:hypothetical protein